MYYFDNQFLQSYLDLVPNITVYVKGQPLTITSKSDLDDTQIGVGYDEYGKPISFPYPQVQQVLAKGQKINLDQLQKSIKGKEKKAAPDKEKEPETDKSSKEGGEGPFAAPSKSGVESEEPKKADKSEKPKEKESPVPEKADQKDKKESVVRLHHFISIDNPKSPQYGLTGIVRHKDNYGIVIEAYNVSSTWMRGDMVTVNKEYI